MLGLTSTETTYGLLGTDEEAGGGGVPMSNSSQAGNRKDRLPSPEH